jgi:hypothetical protein
LRVRNVFGRGGALKLSDVISADRREEWCRGDNLERRNAPSEIIGWSETQSNKNPNFHHEEHEVRNYKYPNSSVLRGNVGFIIDLGNCFNRRAGNWRAAAGSPMLSRSSIARGVYLMFIEKPLFSFLALFAARFSIKVLSGFFFSCFLASFPLLMFVTPYDWLIGVAKSTRRLLIFCHPIRVPGPRFISFQPASIPTAPYSSVRVNSPFSAPKVLR